jgi:fermentation-respiration switch protein FrsA (DUF1100 family)
VLLTAAAIVIVMLAFIWALQRRMIYFPDARVPDPRTLGAEGVEPVTFTTADDLELRGWFFPLAGRRITVLVFNGNAGNRAYRVPLAEALRARGMQVMLMDYRGYGGNPGAPTERGLAADSRAARAYLLSRPDVDARRLVYFGESLGAAVAVDLAAEHAPAALVLRSPFTSLTDIGRYHYRLLPVALLLRDRYPSIDLIRRVHAPLLVIAGDRDGIVPLEFSRRLYEAAAGVPKEFVTIAGADHNDEALLAGDVMMISVARFVAGLLPDDFASNRGDHGRGPGGDDVR